MTKWSNMTPRERDALVAEVVMRWTEVELFCGDYCGVNANPRDPAFAVVPAFTSDPAALERVKREVERRGWEWSVRREGAFCNATIWSGNAPQPPWARTNWADGPTEADAFCHAACLAAGWKEEGE